MLLVVSSPLNARTAVARRARANKLREKGKFPAATSPANAHLAHVIFFFFKKNKHFFKKILYSIHPII